MASNCTDQLHSCSLLFQVGIGSQVRNNRVVEQVIEQGLLGDGDELRDRGDGSFANNRPRMGKQWWENLEWLWCESRVREIIREATDQDGENGKGLDKGLWRCVGLEQHVSIYSVTFRKNYTRFQPGLATWESAWRRRSQRCDRQQEAQR